MISSHKLAIILALFSPIAYAANAQYVDPIPAHQCYYSTHTYVKSEDGTHTIQYQCDVCKRNLTQEIEELRKAYGCPEGKIIYLAALCACGVATASLAVATGITAVAAPQYWPVMAKVTASSLIIPGLIGIQMWREDNIRQKLNSYYKPHNRETISA